MRTTLKSFSGLIRVYLGLLILLVPLSSAAAQSEELTLAVRKNSGYNNGSEIRGSFSMAASGPENLASVTFLVDGQVLDEVSRPPFQTGLRTGNYGFGWHELQARGVTADGRQVSSAVQRFNFVNPEQESASNTRLLTLIFGGVGGVILLVVAGQFLLLRGGKRETLPPGAPRKYGAFGGTICPKCKRPFSISGLGINLSPVHRLQRCPHCGKWSAVRSRPMDDLRRAEQEELKMGAAQLPHARAAAGEKQRQGLDDSKYTDL
jgi:hypothetical protein